jgi:hypothetical protein
MSAECVFASDELKMCVKAATKNKPLTDGKGLFTGRDDQVVAPCKP